MSWANSVGHTAHRAHTQQDLLLCHLIQPALVHVVRPLLPQANQRTLNLASSRAEGPAVTASPMCQRTNVLTAYRELVSLIHRLAPERVQPALQEARAAVRANRAEADALKACDPPRRTVWSYVQPACLISVMM